MLRVSMLADYGTVVLVYMCKYPDVMHNARDIAKHTNIGLPTVSKLLKLFAKHGLLDSQRGTKGGYSLAKVPDDISLAEIIAVIDGEFGVTVCSHNHSDCSLESVCSVRSNWQFISGAISQALQEITLADMCKPLHFTHQQQSLLTPQQNKIQQTGEGL